MPVATHNQRGIGTLYVGRPEGSDVDVDAPDLLRIVERSMSSEIYELMKRSDEVEVVEKAHAHPRFVEDCVREMIRRVVEAYPELGEDAFVCARQENLETIHRHSVVAERTGLVSEIRAELGLRRALATSPHDARVARGSMCLHPGATGSERVEFRTLLRYREDPAIAMETANARDGETALTTRAARLRPSVVVFAILGVAVSVAASLYVLRNAAEAPEVNAIVRGIMALTALSVGLYLWQRQPHNRYGPVLAAAVFFLSPMALAVSQIPGRSRSVEPWAAVAIVYAVFLALIFPDGRPEERGARLVLAATVAASGAVWTAALVLAETLPAGGPFIPCFEDCPNNAARVVEISPDPSNVLGLVYGVVCAGLGLAAAAVLLRRLRAATPIRRRAIGPVLVVIPPVCIGTGAFIFIRQVAPDSPLLDPLGGLVLGAFVLFPLMICVGLIRVGCSPRRPWRSWSSASAASGAPPEWRKRCARPCGTPHSSSCSGRPASRATSTFAVETSTFRTAMEGDR